MNIPKKSILILIITLLIIFVLLYLATQKTDKKEVPLPVQYFSPVPSPTAIPKPVIIPPEMEQEKIAQENYARSREEFLTKNPWILQLPLKSGNYFISFDPENDMLLVTLYYSSQSNKDQQITKAKEEAIESMKKAGIDTDKQKIQYTEVLFK